jgi:hypothetical protein
MTPLRAASAPARNRGRKCPLGRLFPQGQGVLSGEPRPRVRFLACSRLGEAEHRLKHAGASDAKAKKFAASSTGRQIQSGAPRSKMMSRSYSTMLAGSGGRRYNRVNESHGDGGPLKE